MNTKRNDPNYRKAYMSVLKHIGFKRYNYFNNAAGMHARIVELDIFNNHTGYSLEYLAFQITSCANRVEFYDKYIGWLEDPNYTEGFEYMSEKATEDARDHVLVSKKPEDLQKAKDFTAVAYEIAEIVEQAKKM